MNLFKGMDKELNEIVYSEEIGLVSFFERVEEGRIDEALPYVCDDKNGEKVFAGDRVRRISGEPCIVEWYAEECRYILQNNQNCYDLDVYEMEQSIELIKEQA